MTRYLWWASGLVLVVGGLAVALTARTAPADFGWFAYTPLEADWHLGWGDRLGSGSMVIVSRWQLLGAVAAAVGLVVIAARVGFLVGRRRGQGG
ncbi:hypothetical protein [Nocardioides sp.]|uniref:hypothetical protein n=1 Tax=Nocardioides sp. TaxID=35761 RepID=UPI00271FF3E3|nr:hypothetical protein [Nocardioides sp.]MDO9457812.1 hypothetical protein [Nocardioides sp.]